MECTKCGHELSGTGKFCGACGAPVPAAESGVAAADVAEPSPSVGRAWEPARAQASAAPPPPPAAGPRDQDASYAASRPQQPPQPAPQGAGWSKPGTPSAPNFVNALLFTIGGLALIITAQRLTYGAIDSYDSVKPMNILLLLIGIAGAATGTWFTSTRARQGFADDSPVTGSMLTFVLGLATVAYGVLDLLSVMIAD